MLNDKSEVAKFFHDFCIMVEPNSKEKSISFEPIMVLNILTKFKERFSLQRVFNINLLVPTPPQQNDIAERKNHHLLEVAQALTC